MPQGGQGLSAPGGRFATRRVRSDPFECIPSHADSTAGHEQNLCLTFATQKEHAIADFFHHGPVDAEFMGAIAQEACADFYRHAAGATNSLQAGFSVHFLRLA